MPSKDNQGLPSPAAKRSTRFAIVHFITNACPIQSMIEGHFVQSLQKSRGQSRAAQMKSLLTTSFRDCQEWQGQLAHNVQMETLEARLLEANL